MTTATCRNTACGESGIGKPMNVALADGESVTCGACGAACDLDPA